jgi:hypothetical protein
LSKEGRVANILLAGCPWCPYKARFVNKQTTLSMYGDFRITVYNAQDVAESAQTFYILIIVEVIPQAMPHQNTKHCKFSTSTQKHFFLKTASVK